MDVPRYKLKTAPIFCPVALGSLKRNLRIDSEDHNQDVYLQELLDSVIEDVQANIGRQIARATYTAYLDNFPVGDLEITLGPVAAINTIKYYNATNNLTTMPASDYILDNVDLTARLRFLRTYPVYGNRFNAVEIEFSTGWADQASVPKDISDAVILLASERFLNPENAAINFGFQLKHSAADQKLRNYRVQRY